MAEAFVVLEPSHRLNLTWKQFQKPRAERLYALCSALMGEGTTATVRRLLALPAHHELAHLVRLFLAPGSALVDGGSLQRRGRWT